MNYTKVSRTASLRSARIAADIQTLINNRSYYKFQYTPLTGPLPGLNFEQQTEDAINDIGNMSYGSYEIANQALTTADQAYNAAQSAIEIANHAETTAQNAQTTANNAATAAANAQTTADNAATAAAAAQTTADNAVTAAAAAQTTADNAQTAADNAQTSADSAANAATAAQTTANQALTSVNELTFLTHYDNVTDTVDFNNYVDVQRWYMMATDNLHSPEKAKGWLTVDNDYNDTMCRHIFISEATGSVYSRFGHIVEDSDPATVDSWSEWYKLTTAAELDAAVTSLTGSITGLTTRVTTAEENITTLTNGLQTANSNVTALTTRVTTAEGNITTVTNGLAAHVSDFDNPHKVTAAQLGLASAYKFKGSIAVYADLPTAGQQQGDTYNIETADPDHNIKAGDNVSWDGTQWDTLGGNVDLTELTAAVATAQGTADTAKTNAATAQTTANNALPKAGGTMTGPLTLAADPTAALGAATKQYVDSAVAGAGGGDVSAAADNAFTGNNTFAGTSTYNGAVTFTNPGTATNSAITRGYAMDTFLAKDGGTLTGPLTLSGGPTANLMAATKKYVDDAVAGGGGDVTAAGNNTFTGSNVFENDLRVTSGAVGGVDVGGVLTLGYRGGGVTQTRISSNTNGAITYLCGNGTTHTFAHDNSGGIAGNLVTISGTSTSAKLALANNSATIISTANNLMIGSVTKLIGLYPEAADNTAGMRLSNAAEAISTDYSVLSLQNNTNLTYANNAALQVGSFKFLEIDKETKNLIIMSEQSGNIQFIAGAQGNNTATFDTAGNLSIANGLTVGSTNQPGANTGVIRAGNAENCLYFTGTAENTYYATPNTGNTISYQAAANCYLINCSINNPSNLTMNFSGMNFKATIGSVPYMTKTLSFFIYLGTTVPTVAWTFPTGAAVYYPSGTAPTLTANAANIINVIAIVDDTDSFSIQVCDTVAIPYA